MAGPGPGLVKKLFSLKRFEMTPGRRRRRVTAIPRAAAAYGLQLKTFLQNITVQKEVD